MLLLVDPNSGCLNLRKKTIQLYFGVFNDAGTETTAINTLSSQFRKLLEIHQSDCSNKYYTIYLNHGKYDISLLKQLF